MTINGQCAILPVPLDVELVRYYMYQQRDICSLDEKKKNGLVWRGHDAISDDAALVKH